MVEFYKGSIPIIDTEAPDINENEMLFSQKFAYGCIERNYSLFPERMFDPPSKMVLIPETEWDARYDEQEEQKSSLEHIYLSRGGKPIWENLLQGMDGYCWAYSTGHSVMIDRAARNLPYVRLNPHSVAAIIKGGVNDGGWCGESADFFTKVGCAVEGTAPGQWPLQSRNLKFDTARCRGEMKKYRIDEQWVDLTKRVWDRNMTMAQVATSGFNNLPGPGDYHWWGHSVCRLRWVRVERGSWGQLILNSWPNWGRFGLAVLRGNKAICNGALAIRSTTA